MFLCSPSAGECCEPPTTVPCVEQCVDDVAALQYQLDIAFFLDNSCSDCEVLNGSFVLDSVGACAYATSFFTFCSLQYRYEFNIAGDGSLNAGLREQFGSLVVQWKANSHDGNCLTWSNLSIPYLQHLLFLGFNCAAVNPTCAVTAL